MVELRRLSPRVWYLPADEVTDRPNLAVIVGQRASLAVDAGNSPAHARELLNAVAGGGIASLRYAAITHWHWDHVFGLATLDVPGIAHAETRRRVLEQASLDWSDEALDQRVTAGSEAAFCRDMIRAELPDRSELVIRAPDITFDERVEVDLGGLTAVIEHVGGNHGPDCSIVYVPEERVLLLGDCLGADIYGGPPAYTRDKLFDLMDRLAAYEALWYQQGHGEPVARDRFWEYASTLRAVGELVGVYGDDVAAIKRGFARRVGRPASDDDLWDAQAFMAGEARCHS